MSSNEAQLRQLLNNAKLQQQEQTINDNTKFRDWFLRQFHTANNCNLEDFAIYYLQSLRQCTEKILQSVSTPSESISPKCQTPIRSSLILKANTNSTPKTPGLINITSNMLESINSSASISLEENSIKSNISNVSSEILTPVRKWRKSSNTSTPQSGSKQTGICLADFLLNTPPTHNRPKKKHLAAHGQDTGAAIAATVRSSNKPKKRVVPTTLSKSISANNEEPFGHVSSSIASENNLLKLSSSQEIVDRNECTILKARQSLKMQAQEISREMKANPLVVTSATDVILSVDDNNKSIEMVDLSKVTNTRSLELLAEIYVQLIELNLVPNFLTELAFLIQLLNVNMKAYATKMPLTNAEKMSSELALLYDLPNCIYFAVYALERQRNCILQLDLKSLSVILNYERTSLLSKELKTELESVYNIKQKLNQQSQAKESFIPQNVYYQPDKESRENFCSQHEFGAFKSQRDLFCKAYKLWETQHMQAKFKFAREITPKIREMFRLSENAINMTHFAKLFVSQLLISANDVITSPQELGIEMDMKKFTKLTQRLVEPSIFSVNYKFPRSQAYFRNFINECQSIAFLVHLKLALYAQLRELNDSFEQLILNNTEQHVIVEEEITQQTANCIFIVRPEVLSSMLILAKFLGYVTALPYNQAIKTSAITQQVVEFQLELRSQFQSDFNLCYILETALHAGKLLITIPWLVEYLIMLDSITLHLPNYVATLQLLFELYRQLGVEHKLCLVPTAVFILRCCIGQLLDTKPEIAEHYYNYRAARDQYGQETDTKLISMSLNYLRINAKQPAEAFNMNYHCVLEQLLNVACPFLSEFRVLIMPAKYAFAKLVSRTGRYRHITTRLTALQTSISNETDPSQVLNEIAIEQQQQQNTLVEAFLHSQHTSMRRLIEFITESTYKSVVKDAQHQILLPSKAAADNEVNALTSTKFNEVLKAVQDIYNEALEQALQQWASQVPSMLEERIKKCLDTLLPQITNDVIKRTYYQLIKRNAKQQIQMWLQTNVIQTNFYYAVDLNDMCRKICDINKYPTKANNERELHIVSDAPNVADVLIELKYWLHCTSMLPHLVDSAHDLEQFISRIHGVFVHTLPTAFYQLLGISLIQIFQHLISRHTQLLTAHMIELACHIWNMPAMRKLGVHVEDECPVPALFEALLTAAFIETLGTQHAAYMKLQELLLALLMQNIISVDFVNTAFISLFKHNWPPEVWQELSMLLERVASKTCNAVAISEDDSNKTHLFMEVLADLSRDLDF